MILLGYDHVIIIGKVLHSTGLISFFIHLYFFRYLNVWITENISVKNKAFGFYSCISFSQRNSISKTFTISIVRVRIPLMLSK